MAWDCIPCSCRLEAGGTRHGIVSDVGGWKPVPARRQRVGGLFKATIPAPFFSITISSGDEGVVPTYECPICERLFKVDRPENAPFRPFCCERCKLIDLGRWLDGTYRVSEPLKPEDLEELGEEGPEG